MGYWLKKTAGFWMMPLSTAVLCIGLGLLLLWFSRYQRSGKVLVSAGLFWLLFCSLSVTSNGMLRPLERIYPEYAGQPVEYVVVLGALIINDPDIPLHSRLSSSASARLAEGMRIALRNPNARLILTGKDNYSRISIAQMYKQVAIADGFPEERIITVDTARDTEEEAQGVATIAADKPLALVTEASHMPRAMALFRAKGLDPVAAPTFFSAVPSSWRNAYIDVDNLKKADRAIYEYLGQAFAFLTGKTSPIPDPQP